LRSHILSIDHSNNTPEDEMEDYEELRQLLSEEINSGKKKGHEKDNIDKDTKDYLDFVAFCISQRLSFNQIELLGKFLQKAHKDKRLKFLSGFNLIEDLCPSLCKNVLSL